jgi:hypothetical protein
LVTGSDLSITWCTSVKMAVVAPIPNASVTTAVVVTPGAFRSCRTASRKSASTGPSGRIGDLQDSFEHYLYTVRSRKGYVIAIRKDTNGAIESRMQHGDIMTSFQPAIREDIGL